ncbi:MAG TPA: AraC family transcriptional regulator [Thermoleophilaceae bacterium]|jgi:AraC-like DNA-binding protein
MLDSRTIAAEGDIAIADVACTHERGRGETTEYADRHAVVFVRRGCFSRVADGVEALLDPTTAYCMNPGEEQRYDHPHSHGDDCTAVFLPAELVGDLTRDGRLPSRALPVSSAADLEHRLLVHATHEADVHEVIERSIALAALTVGHVSAPRPRARRPAARRAHAALAAGAREALADDPDASLSVLAARLAVSPHHLSRVFRAQTGKTIARHRMRLRARAALERLGGGESDLGRLAADLGFADQSHMCRVLDRETGRTPAALRHALGASSKR